MRVKPTIVTKMPLSDVDIGEVFSFNGVKYIKIDEGDEFDGVTAITLHPIDFVDIKQDTDICVEKAVFAKYIAFMRTHTKKDVIDYELPDTDMYREYAHVLKPYIDEVWYVDNGEDDALHGNEFFYVDKFADLRKYVPDKPIALHTVEKLGIRVVHYFEPYTTVFVKNN